MRKLYILWMRGRDLYNIMINWKTIRTIYYWAEDEAVLSDAVSSRETCAAEEKVCCSLSSLFTMVLKSNLPLLKLNGSWDKQNMASKLKIQLYRVNWKMGIWTAFWFLIRYTTTWDSGDRGVQKHNVTVTTHHHRTTIQLSSHFHCSWYVVVSKAEKCLPFHLPA